MDIERARKYIASVRWQFAKTMSNNPHEYTVREWNKDKESEFIWFVEAIREFGVQEKFYKATYSYFTIDTWKYWTMGSPIDKTIIINRARI